MCSLDDPDVTGTWLLFDKALGAQVFDDRGVRLSTQREIDEIPKSEELGSQGENFVPG